METRIASAPSSRSCWKVRSAFSALVPFPPPCPSIWLGGRAFELLQQVSVMPLPSSLLKIYLLHSLQALLAMAKFSDDKC